MVVDRNAAAIAEAEARKAQAILAKALKTSEPTKFMDKEIIMKALTYRDDLIIQSIVNDVFQEASDSGLEGAVLERVILTTQVMAHVKMFAHNVDGTPLYATMEAINTAAKEDIKVFTAINDLFVLFMQTMELSKAEKKS